MGARGRKWPVRLEGQSRRVSRTCGPDHPSPLLCVVEPGLNILVLLPSQTATPLSPGRGGARAGAAGVRDVSLMSVGPRAMRYVRLAFVFITLKASSKEIKNPAQRKKDFFQQNFVARGMWEEDRDRVPTCRVPTGPKKRKEKRNGRPPIAALRVGQKGTTRQRRK